ncbi:succinate dehydrogenase [ubiquinone] cytochrome b small subunit, mitochondrial [Homalodisca vitripennis]|nr:succinate dehydrogenase [ubiquinone] cytochrome b small subunit, mitochondrial [Homalodisca vitripennis]
MALSCLLRNSIRHIKVSPIKNVVLQNQFRLSSCFPNLQVFSNNKPPVCSTKLSQLDVVKRISTSPIVQSEHGDHTKIWTAERALSGALLLILPVAVMVPSAFFDTLMALSITMHMHWGIEAIVVDYVRPIIFGSVIPKIAVTLVYVLSIATLAGLLNFIFNDVGLANGIRMLWKL